jgi:hypothetical protein
MLDWHRRVAADLTARTPSGGPDEGDVALEVALGQAREAIAFVLELARAHRIAAAGNLIGDDVWVHLGAARARFTLSRRDARITFRQSPGEGTIIRWEAAQSALVDARGQRVEALSVARRAMDSLLTEWSTNPVLETTSSPRHKELDDEPTKG